MWVGCPFNDTGLRGKFISHNGLLFSEPTMADALHIAAVQNNKDTVLSLLNRGANINAVNSFQNTALHWSAFRDSHEVAGVLLQHGVDVDATNKRGQTALHVASTNNSTRTLKLLLQYKSDQNKVDSEGNTAMHVAALNDRHDIVSILVNHGADLNIKNKDGRAPLHVALTFKCKNVAIFLIDHGADLRSVSLSGLTVFQWAAINDKELLLMLIKRGASVSISDEERNSAFLWAVEHNPDLVPLLIEYGTNINAANHSGMTALHLATLRNEKLAIDLVRRGADVNLKDQQGHSALHLAATSNCKELTKCLLENNADVNAVDEYDNTALHKAAEADLKELSGHVVQLLFERGANINARNNYERTALQFAIENNNKTITEFLLNHGADANIVDVKGENALHSAVKISSKELAGLVLDHVNDINIRNRNGETCLHFAAKYSNKVTVSLLLDRGAHVNAVNDLGQTPLHCACIHSQTFGEEITRLLLSQGVETNHRDNLGRTALHYAVVNGTLSTTTQLVESGAKINAVDDSGKVTLNEVLFLKKLDLAQYLLRQPGIIVRIFDENGNSPFHLLAQVTTVTESPLGIKSTIAEIANQLLARGALVNARNLLDQTALHLASSACIAEILLEKGAWPNAKEMYTGNTPLLSYTKASFVADAEYAIDCNYLQTLISMGMSPWIANDIGETVLGNLLGRNYFQTARCLIQLMKGKGDSNVNNKHSNDETLLHVICSSGTDETLQFINLLLESRAHVNALNGNGETPLHILCKKITHMSEDTITRRVFLSAVGRLVDSGADVNIRDRSGDSSIQIAQGIEQFCILLKCPAKLSEHLPCLKWLEPKSHKHNFKLSEVVNGKMSFCVQSYQYHKEPIGYGSFSHVYAGIDVRDGREVAVKRMEKDRLCQSEDQREISSLVKLCNCEDVVRYFCCLEDSYFIYIILELMEGTLDEYLDIQTHRQHDKGIELCKDVVRGLHFFHELRVLHRDIKPDNILYKVSPRLCFKIADFGLSTEINTMEFKSVIHGCVGTRCWMAPELLHMVGKVNHSFASDVFACGLVLHYILDAKNHPFSSPLEIGNERSIVAKQIETEKNILEQNLNLSKQLTSESRDLIDWMLCKDELSRPTTREIINHPLFWSRKKKTLFLVAVGNQQEFSFSRYVQRDHSTVEKELENCLDPTFSEEPWDFSIYPTYTEITSTGRRYNTSSSVDLVRFIRNANAHVSDPNRSNQVKKDILDNIFLDKFPSLLIQVYKVIKANKWDEERTEIMSVLSSE